MDKKINIVLADDSPDVRCAIALALDTVKDIDIVAQCENGEQVISVLKSQQVDILVLDIIMPYLDGFGVLEKIIDEKIPMPEIIVLSCVGSSEVVRRMMQLGARYYMVKPFRSELLIKRIRCIANGTTGNRGHQGMHRQIESAQSLDETITGIFLTIGIPAHIKGFQYLRKAVKMVMQKPTMMSAITKELYPGVALAFDTSASKVERAIRHAIEIAWNREKIDNINQIFGYNIYSKNDKPTNGEFIALVADKLSVDNQLIL